MSTHAQKIGINAHGKRKEMHPRNGADNVNSAVRRIRRADIAVQRTEVIRFHLAVWIPMFQLRQAAWGDGHLPDGSVGAVIHAVETNAAGVNRRGGGKGVFERGGAIMIGGVTISLVADD